MTEPTIGDKLKAALTKVSAELTRIDTTSLGLKGVVKDLQDMIEATEPTTPPAPQLRPRLAVHDYDGNTPLDYARYDVFDVQRGTWWSPGGFTNSQETYIYTTFVKRPKDPVGFTQFLAPSEVVDADLLHNSVGDPMWRNRDGGEYLCDFSDANWQARAIERMVAEAQRYSADGVYLDEVDQTAEWAWNTTNFKEFQGDSLWQAHMLAFIKRLADALHNAKRKLWINLGADYNPSNTWQNELRKVVDGINIEFFVAREGVAQDLMNVNNGWYRQTDYVAATEQAGTPVHVHASTNNQSVVNYAFYSWLSCTYFRGSFSAGLKHIGSPVVPTPSVLAAAMALGMPTGRATQIPNTYYVRQFENGKVLVNPYPTSKGDLAAMSGKIVLT